jgi:hypothetical protein
LVVVGAQAVTPDAQDLSSAKLLQIVCAASDDPGGPGEEASDLAALPVNESPPLRGAADEDTPDELCVPVRTTAGSIVRPPCGGSPREGLSLAGQVGRPTSPLPSLGSGSRGGARCRTRLIHALCRLTC